MFGRIGALELLIIVAMAAVSLIVVVWPVARICRRAGFSPWLGVLAVVPVANLFLLWFVAMAPWPASNSAGGA